jgi:nucleotide-binding universal stress UspA family protein
MTGSQTILHPSDFSENSRAAFEAACALARDGGSTLVVLHVMMPSAAPLLSGPTPDPLRPIETQGQQSRLPWPWPSDTQICVEHRLAEGDPAEEILRLAATLHCRLIVMGSHGRTGLGRLLTGSVAEDVLRRAGCPVLVVKAPLKGEANLETKAAALPGEPIDLRPLGPSLPSAHTKTLIHTTAVEVVRLIVCAGQEVARQGSSVGSLVHCLEGRVVLSALDKTTVVEAGTLLLLPAEAP